MLFLVSYNTSTLLMLLGKPGGDPGNYDAIHSFIHGAWFLIPTDSHLTSGKAAHTLSAKISKFDVHLKGQGRWSPNGVWQNGISKTRHQDPQLHNPLFSTPWRVHAPSGKYIGSEDLNTDR